MSGGKHNFHEKRVCHLCDTEFSPRAANHKWCCECVPTSGWRARAVTYGIGVKQWEDLLQKQKGTCALCDREPTMIDHRHDDGVIRGLLCRRCNTLLAGIDDKAWLERASVYAEASAGIVPHKVEDKDILFSTCYRGHEKTAGKLCKTCVNEDARSRRMSRTKDEIERDSTYKRNWRNKMSEGQREREREKSRERNKRYRERKRSASK